MKKSNYTRTYPYLYRGVVEQNVDPRNLGRCKIRVPSIHGELLYPADALPWARPISNSAVRRLKGSVNVPDVGDIVWVMFEGAEKEFPVYIGGTYGEEDGIIANPGQIVLFTEYGNSITYDRGTEEFIVTIQDTQFHVSKDGVDIRGDATIDGDLKVNGNISTSKSLQVEGNISAIGDISTLSNLKVRKNANIDKDVTVLGNLDVRGYIDTVGSIRTHSNLYVEGTTYLQDLVINGSCNKEGGHE